jgi:hypothetical protein
MVGPDVRWLVTGANPAQFPEKWTTLILSYALQGHADTLTNLDFH